MVCLHPTSGIVERLCRAQQEEGGQRQAQGTDVMDAAPQAGVRHRHRDVSRLWRHIAGHCLHRGCIEDALLIAKILGHVRRRDEAVGPDARAPPAHRAGELRLV